MDDEGVAHDQDEEAGPDRGAMYFAGGPQIVAYEQEQKRIDEHAVHERVGRDRGEGRSSGGSIKERDGGNQDQSLVDRGLKRARKAK